MKRRSFTTYQLALIALMTAFLCILGPFTLAIPFSPIPLSLANLAVSLTAVILGQKAGVLACLLYLLMGLTGLPVFSGFTGGFGKLLGPTGGYLTGYLFLAIAGGWFAERFPGVGTKERIGLLGGLLLGMLLLYAFGTAWFSYTADSDFAAALAVGVWPFLPGDLLKMGLVVWIGPQIRGRLMRTGLLD